MGTAACRRRRSQGVGSVETAGVVIDRMPRRNGGVLDRAHHPLGRCTERAQLFA
jgi:hypothetical protein